MDLASMYVCMCVCMYEKTDSASALSEPSPTSVSKNWSATVPSAAGVRYFWLGTLGTRNLDTPGYVCQVCVFVCVVVCVFVCWA